VLAAAPARRYAGFWRRVLGRIIDSLITSIASGTIGAVLGAGMFASPGPGPAPAMDALFNGLGFLVPLAYFWFFNSRGQTLGQMVIGVKIIDADGNPPGTSKALIRVLMSFVSGLALGLGFLWAAFHREKRTWHDIVAGTWVVRV
jgi:uncharacterized RDD family membrane protein YckC